jgi:hypothetical protein
MAPRTATVQIDSAAWEEALERADVRRVDDFRADVVVATAGRVRQWTEPGSRAFIVEGRAAGVPGYHARTYLALPDLNDPRLLVPLDRSHVFGYALATRWLPTSRRRALRKAAVMRIPGLPDLLRRLSSQCVTVMTAAAEQPFLVATAAKELKLDAPLDFFLVAGEGDYLARGAFVCFRPQAASPEWVVKFARVRGYAEPFERDERGLALAASAGGRVAAHSPRLLHRFAYDGFETSVESAAVGCNLADVLRSPLPTGSKRQLVETIADWIVDLGLETRGERAQTETERLARDVLPRWPVVSPSVLDGLEQLPGILQHNDLGAWNVVTQGTAFTVLDWESARGGGLPLWDLWYFLADVLPLLDGDAADRVAAFRRLFRGEAPSSSLLFGWTRRAVRAFRVPSAQVGPLATLCWLHHGLSHVRRAGSLARYSDEARMQWPPEHFPRIWLEDPDLGPGWERWLDTRAERAS